MAANNYEICCALASAYIAKPDKKHHGMMTNDRREIDEREIMALIDFYLNREVDEGHCGIQFPSRRRDGKIIQMKFVDAPKD